MAKSKLVGLELKQDKDDIANFPVWEYKLLINNIDTSINLKALNHKFCKVSTCEKDRLHQIINYAHSFKNEVDRGTSHATVYSNFLKFRRYLIWCDNKELYPFNETTWKQYHDYLWELVLVGSQSIPLWLMTENNKIGLRESSANIMFSETQQALLWCNENVFNWGRQLKKLRSSKTRSHEAYSEKELSIILNRLSSYFFKLAIPLLQDNVPDKITIEIEKIIFDIYKQSNNTKGMAKQGLLNLDTCFNQAMACANYILSYFTAFNSSQLIDLHHPIDWIDDKSGAYCKLTAYKKRANSEVLSLVGGEVHRKSLKFLDTLIALSLKYSNSGNHSLLYLLDRNNENFKINSTILNNANLGNKLLLLSDKSESTIPYLIKIFNNFIASSPKGYIEFDEFKIINKTLTRNKKIIKRFYKRRIFNLSFHLLNAIIYRDKKNNNRNLQLRNIILPLKILKLDDSYKISFSYDNSNNDTFYISGKYVSFLEDLVAYAQGQELTKKQNFKYLLPPSGDPIDISESNIIPNAKDLSDYGIRSDEFFVSLTSSRFRETAAKIARRKANRSELDISQILSNQYKTVLKHYSEGNHYDNQIIIAQGISAIEYVSSGLSLEESKKQVALKSSLPVIKFEEMNSRQESHNGIGISCSEKTSIVDQGNTSSQKACFDYEKCIQCKYAKIINEVDAIYRLLSFIECMEESWLYYPERFSKNIGETVNLYKKVIFSALPLETINLAQEKLDNEGRHILWSNLEIVSLGYKGV